MKLFNNITVAGWVLILAGALATAGCGSDETTDTTAGAEAATEEGGEAAAEEGGEAAAEEGGEAAAEEGGEAAAEEGGEAATEEGGEAATEEGGEAATEEGGEAAAEEGGESFLTECGPDGAIYCPAPLESSSEVVVEQVAEGSPDAFTGGDVPAGDYLLTKVTLYPGSMTADGSKLPVDVTITNNGSNGSAIFDGDAWGLSANLDLAISALGNDIALAESLLGGGCFTAEGVTLTGDVTQCAAEGTTSDFTLPSSFDYSNDGTTVELLLNFPVDALLGGLEGNPIAGVLSAVLVNDLQVVLTMEATVAE